MRRPQRSTCPPLQHSRGREHLPACCWFVHEAGCAAQLGRSWAGGGVSLRRQQSQAVWCGTACTAGATSVSDPLKLTKVSTPQDLLYTLAAVSHAPSPELLLSLNVAGFIYVQDIDVAKGTGGCRPGKGSKGGRGGGYWGPGGAFLTELSNCTCNWT